MKLVVVVLGLCAVALVSASLFPAFPTPAFFWAGNNFFAGQNECLGTYKTDAVTDFVIRLNNGETSGNELFKFVKENQPLEAIVLFIDPKPALSNDFYSFLQPILSQAGSVILPFVYKSPSLTTVSQDILYGVEGQKIIASNTLPGALKRDQLVANLQNNDVFSNGKTDLIVVYLEKEENRAAFVESVNNVVKAQTTAYLGMLIADTDYVREEEAPRQNKREIEVRNAGYYADSKYWPRGIWEGLLVTVLLLFILTTGLWCNAEVQTPSKFEKPKTQQ